MKSEELDALFNNSLNRTELACMVFTEEDWDERGPMSPYEAMNAILEYGGKTMSVPVNCDYNEQGKLLVFPWLPRGTKGYDSIDKAIKDNDLCGFCSDVYPASYIKMVGNQNGLNLVICTECLCVDVVTYEDTCSPTFGTHPERLVDVLKSVGVELSGDRPRGICSRCKDTFGCSEHDDYAFEECLHRIDPHEWRIIVGYMAMFNAVSVTDF